MKRTHFQPVALTLLLLALLGAAISASAERFYDRNAIPGNFTIGIYSDEDGSSKKVTLGKDDDEFQVWIGLTGDSTRVFSGAVFKLQLPPHMETKGPVRWTAIPGLKSTGSLSDPGLSIEFNKACLRQTGPEPVMLGRLTFAVEPGFKKGTLMPEAHNGFGLSVELCLPDGGWPKPYATGVALEVERKFSFIERIQSWFD